MASRREYDMLFQLSAQMNGNFTGTFSKAQQQLLSFQKEVQELNRTQGDISAYEKQQQAVESTKKKLETLQQQYDNIQREIQETWGYSSDLENKLLSKQQQIDKTSASLERQTQKLDQMGTSLREAGVDTGNLEKESERLGAEMSDLKKKQEEAAEGAKIFEQESNKAITAVGEVLAAAGIAAALHEIYEAYMECVSVAGNFEESMSNVEALAGASTEELRQLSDLAKELGATTKFTAKDSADAMGYMAMAGWDAQQMLAGMPGVLQLAAASGEDLAMVSDIVTDNLSAFGLTAADTARFSDVLAAAATNANTNVSIMGETFKMSASVAGALGYSIEDVATAVGLMANSGVKGSIAGTALKNTFNGLLKGVTLTGAAFGEYEYSSVKADGTMKSFGATIDELRGYFDRMTEAERVNNAMTIAGERGYNGLLAILNATDEDYASLTQSINDCSGAASRMASIKMDNLNGELVLMNSAWDALKTTIGEQFIPEMRTLYSVGADVFGVIDDFVQDNPALIKAIGTFVGAIGLATSGVTAYVAISKVATALNLGATLVTAGPIMIGVAAVAALTAGVVALVSSVNDGIPSVKELTEATRDMRDAMDEANATYAETATQTIATAEVVGIYIDKLEEIEAATGGAVEGNLEYHNILALLTRTVPELADSIDLTNDTIEGGTDALRKNTEEWKKNADAQAYQEYINSLYDEYSSVMTEAAENSIKLTQAQIKLQTAEKNWDSALARMNELSDEAYENGTMLSGEYYELENAIRGYQDEMYEAERTIENLNKAIDADSEAVSAAKAEIESAKDAVERLTGVTEEQTAAEAEAAAQTQELQSVIGGTAEQVSTLVEAYNTAYAAALDSISGQYALWDKAADVVKTSASSINRALESQITYWQDYNTNLQSLTERSHDIAGLSDVIASFADGSAESVNAIAGLASSSDEDLASMVENWKALQEEQTIAAGSVANLKTDFTKTMDELQTELAADIEAMDLGEEAKESGKATIQGYINGANSMLYQVRSAYADIGRAALKALGSEPYSNSAYVENRTIPMYASGTKSAAPGLALVGEEGPELVFFSGGEQVMTARETASIQASLADENMQMIELAPQIVDAMNIYRPGKAYTVAYDSIPEQYNHWNDTAGFIATNTGDFHPEHESQVSSRNTYCNNLESSNDSIPKIAGLSDMIASFTDESAESVNTVSGTETATNEDLAAMVQNWRDLQKAQSETSDVIADFKTDFTNQMDELTQQLQDDIEALDMSADAAESGRSTIQAFIDSAAAMESSVQAAYARLGRAAASALSSASGTSVTVNTHGYAIGTNYAEAGLAIVGENGPELMMMQGGEKILTAAETRALQEEYIEAMMFLPELFKQLRGYAGGTDNAAPSLAWVGEHGPEAILGAQFTMPRIDAEEAIPDIPGHGSDGGGYIVTFSPVYNISGDMPVEELQEVLREHDERMKEQLEELLEELEEEKARRAYR